MQLRSERAFHFDSYGDLIFKVGNPKEVLEFLVCSRTVARSSAVFRAMLYGGFAESKPQATGNSWVVELPEDRACPLLVVLSIIHGHFTYIPNGLKQNEMYHVLTITEKYDMTHILRPWAKVWFQPYEDIRSPAGNEMLLWISWEIGHVKMVCDMSKSLLLGSQVDKNGQLVTSGGVPLKKYVFLEPPGMLGKLLLLIYCVF
ncbi:uncharacterized protein CTRU02_208221 [Colletotrichum truncatum]|uniref:Uncharacterized protein n=1 Tax=Colletotrichum truncatum TaxID=5467 RepID=A0ACC3YX33_COLTU